MGNIESFGHNLGPHGQAESDGKWEADNPLANGIDWQHRIDKMGCRLAHPPPTAGWAEPSALAAERDQVLMMATLTLGPQEAMTEQAAPQILLELLGYEIRKWIARITDHLVLKAEPIGLDEFVKSCLLRLVPGIGKLFDCRI